MECIKCSFCLLTHVDVFNNCVQHSDGLNELQGIEFSFSLARFFRKTFRCLTVWPPTISWRFLLRLNAIICVALNTPWNLMFSCKMFQFRFTILDMLGSVLLYVIDSGILFLLFFLNAWLVLFFQFYQLSWFAHLKLLLYIVGLETSVNDSTVLIKFCTCRANCF